MADAYIPKSLRYLVRELQSSRTTVKFSPSTSTTVSAGGIIRVRCPEGIIDLGTLTYRGYNVLSGTSAVGPAAVPPKYKLIQKATWYAGGVALGAMNNNYNVVKNAIIKSSFDSSIYSSRALHNYLEDQTEFVGNVSGGNIYCCEDNILGLSQSPVLYNSAIFGPLELEIQLADATYLKFSSIATTANVASVSYQDQNIDFVVERVNPPMAYVAMLAERVKTGGAIKFPFLNVITNVQQNLGSNRINVSAKSVDVFMAMPFNSSNYTSNGYENKRFVYNSGQLTASALRTNNLTAQLLYGDQAVPQNGPEYADYLYDYSVHCWNKNAVNTYNMLALPASNQTEGTLSADFDNWATDKHIISFDLTMEGQGWNHPEGVLSGVNTMNQQVDFIFNTTGYSSSMQWLFVLLCTSVLKWENGMVSVEL